MSDTQQPEKEKAPEVPEEAVIEAPAKKKLSGFFAALKPEPVPERREGRLSALPEGEKSYPRPVTVVGLGLAVAMILVSVFVKDLPETAVLALRIAAALFAGFGIVWNTVNDLRARAFTSDGLPLIFALIFAFVNGMNLEAAIAAVTFQAALCLRSYAYCRVKSTLRSSISLPAQSFELGVGDSVMLESGQASPADCRVIQGSITADLSFVYGKRTEKTLRFGDILPAGCQVISGSAMAEVTVSASSSAVTAMADAIADGFEDVTRTERTINRVASVLVPALFAVGAILLAVLPLVFKLSFGESMRRVITIVAVVSPCGVLASIPLIGLAAMTALRKQGVVFRSSSALDGLSFAKTVIFEKSGTVTSELFEVSEVYTDRMDPATFLKVAAHAAYSSDSPMARAVVSAYGGLMTGGLVSNFTEQPGWGVGVTVNGIGILLGTGSFMDRNRIAIQRVSGADCALYMSVGGVFAGRITLNNSVSGYITDTVAQLRANGVDRVVMISGDGRERDSEIARQIGVDEYYSECGEEEKIRSIKEIRSRVDEKSSLIYVRGPGGAPETFSSADIGVEIDAFGLKSLKRGADVLIMGPTAEKLPDILRAGKSTRRFVLICAAAGLAVKLALALAGGLGAAPLWFAVLLDSCVSLALLLSCFVLPKTAAGLK